MMTYVCPALNREGDSVLREKGRTNIQLHLSDFKSSCATAECRI